MISPVIVEQINGLWAARCHARTCDKPHIVALTRGLPAAEAAADHHLKEINGRTARNPTEGPK